MTLKVPEAGWWWTAYKQLLQYGFWLSVSGVRCLLTLNTLETLPSAQMDISTVKGPVLWLQLFYNTTQKSNQREWHWVIFDLKSWLCVFHQGFKDLNGCQLNWNITHIIFRHRWMRPQLHAGNSSMLGATPLCPDSTKSGLKKLKIACTPKGAWNWERDAGTRKICTSSSSSDATSPPSPTSSHMLLMLY